MDDGKPQASEMLACGACGCKYARGQKHSCATAAAKAEQERLAGEPPLPMLDIYNVAAAKGGSLGRHVPSGKTLWLALHPPQAQHHPQCQPMLGDLAYYRDDSGFSNGTAEQHWCLCDLCHSRLLKLLRLSRLGSIEHHSARLRTILTKEQAADWRPDVDGCDACGWPPAGQPRTRRGPSELFAILYELEAFYEGTDLAR